MPEDTRSSDTSHIDTLRQLNEAYIRSVATSDVRCFEQQLLSKDFLNSNPDGSIVDRATFLAQIGRLAAVTNLKCEDVRIRLFGGFAIVHGRTTYTKPDGEAGAGRYTDIWAFEDGRWQCVAAHVTRA